MMLLGGRSPHTELPSKSSTRKSWDVNVRFPCTKVNSWSQRKKDPGVDCPRVSDSVLWTDCDATRRSTVLPDARQGSSKVREALPPELSTADPVRVVQRF